MLHSPLSLHAAILGAMSTCNSNIEAIARHLCARRMERAALTGMSMDAAVDRYWHCVAAELEAGLIDESGNRLVPYEFDQDLAAYHDWCSRHS